MGKINKPLAHCTFSCVQAGREASLAVFSSQISSQNLGAGHFSKQRGPCTVLSHTPQTGHKHLWGRATDIRKLEIRGKPAAGLGRCKLPSTAEAIHCLGLGGGSGFRVKGFPSQEYALCLLAPVSPCGSEAQDF